MLVKIFTLKNGLETIEDVLAVRIISKDYNLLILKDYISIIGKVEGKIEIEYPEHTKALDNIVGYYVCIDNVFNLMIEGE
jgi:hypothetical protein